MSVATFTNGGYLGGRARARDFNEQILSGQAATIREMLGVLHTLTPAGCCHSMSKVVAFVGGHARAIARRMGTGNGRAVFGLIQGLERESERRVPDVATFSRHAEDLLALLAAVA